MVGVDVDRGGEVGVDVDEGRGVGVDEEEGVDVDAREGSGGSCVEQLEMIKAANIKMMALACFLDMAFSWRESMRKPGGGECQRAVG